MKKINKEDKEFTTDFYDFDEWFHKQPFASNPYIDIDYMAKYWIDNIKNKIKTYDLGRFRIVRTKKDIMRVSIEVEKAALKAIQNDRAN